MCTCLFEFVASFYDLTAKKKELVAAKSKRLLLTVGYKSGVGLCLYLTRQRMLDAVPPSTIGPGTQPVNKYWSWGPTKGCQKPAVSESCDDK